MTATPETLPTTPTAPVKEPNYLESMFYLGYAESEDLTVYKDEKQSLVVKFRTITPPEMREILELSGTCDAVAARVITERIETLARSIIHINNMPLIWTTAEREDFYSKEKRHPSPLEMARDILWNKIKSIVVIDTLYEAYVKFSTKVEESFEDIKKKLNNPPSSSST